MMKFEEYCPEKLVSNRAMKQVDNMYSSTWAIFAMLSTLEQCGEALGRHNTSLMSHASKAQHSALFSI